MANLFVHFEPTGHSLRHNAKMEAEAAMQDVHEKYQDSLNRGVSGHENDQSGLPSYIVAGTPEDSHWRQQHPDGQVCDCSVYFCIVVIRGFGPHLDSCSFSFESLEVQTRLI